MACIAVGTCRIGGLSVDVDGQAPGCVSKEERWVLEELTDKLKSRAFYNELKGRFKKNSQAAACCILTGCF